MPLKVTNAESDIFAPSALLSLYEIDTRFVAVNGQRWLLCPSVNGKFQSIIWNDETYTPFPIEMTEASIPGQGTLPRPKLRASNINGFLSQFLRLQGDFVGARFIRRRVYARFLPGENFVGGVNPYGTPNAAAAYEDEIYFINRKVDESPEAVEFELASPMELDNVQLPRRLALATNCVARPYRDPETCGYSGPPMMDSFGNLRGVGGYGFTLSNEGLYSTGAIYQPGDYVYITSENDFTYGDTFYYVCSTANTSGSINNPQFNGTNWIADACPHNLSGCKSHFPTGPLPFLGFPGTSRSPYVN